jgi:hypothetical protein
MLADGIGEELVAGGFCEVDVGEQVDGNGVDELPAGLAGIARGGVVGWMAGLHEAAEGGSVVAGEGLEVGEERLEIAVIAGGETGPPYDIHALDVAPGIEGLAIGEAGAVLDIEGLASGHDERLDLGWLHVAALSGRQFGWLAGR